MDYKELLKQAQKLSLDEKIELSKQKIKEFYEFNNGNVVMSFSGGKDSTILLHLVRTIYPEVKAVFFNATNEDNRIIKFVRETDNVEIIHPDKTFKWSLQYEGYPLVSKEIAGKLNSLFRYTYKNTKNERTIVREFFGLTTTKNKQRNYKFSKKWLWLIDKNMFKNLENIAYKYNVDFNKYKNFYFEKSIVIRNKLGLNDNTKIYLTKKCCDYLKKQPADLYQKRYGVGFYIGVMAEESSLRKASFVTTGCINLKKKVSTPIAWWTTENIWEYINKYNVRISTAYETETRTGCIMCGFGLQFEQDRLDTIKNLYPKRYRYYRNIRNVNSDITFGEAIDLLIKFSKGV